MRQRRVGGVVCGVLQQKEMQGLWQDDDDDDDENDDDDHEDDDEDDHR